VIVGVAFVKLLSMLCNIIRRRLQLAPWRVEVVSDSDPRVYPIDPHGVCSYLQCLRNFTLFVIYNLSVLYMSVCCHYDSGSQLSQLSSSTSSKMFLLHTNYVLLYFTFVQ